MWKRRRLGPEASRRRLLCSCSSESRRGNTSYEHQREGPHEFAPSTTATALRRGAPPLLSRVRTRQLFAGRHPSAMCHARRRPTPKESPQGPKPGPGQARLDGALRKALPPMPADSSHSPAILRMRPFVPLQEPTSPRRLSPTPQSQVFFAARTLRVWNFGTRKVPATNGKARLSRWSAPAPEERESKSLVAAFRFGSS